MLERTEIPADADEEKREKEMSKHPEMKRTIRGSVFLLIPHFFLLLSPASLFRDQFAAGRAPLARSLRAIWKRILAVSISHYNFAHLPLRFHSRFT